MNCNAQRVAKYALLNINSNGEYETVGIYSTMNKTVDYWNVTWRFGEPSDTPKCGYDLSKCPSKSRFPVHINPKTVFEIDYLLLYAALKMVESDIKVIDCNIYFDYRF